MASFGAASGITTIPCTLSTAPSFWLLRPDTDLGMNRTNGLPDLQGDWPSGKPLAIPQKDLPRMRRHGQGYRAPTRAIAQAHERSRTALRASAARRWAGSSGWSTTL